MSVALLLCPDAAPERLVEDARRLRWIAGLLRGLGAQPLVVIATVQMQRDPALALAGCSLTAAGLRWTLITAETPASLSRRLALRLRSEAVRLAVFYDWPELEVAPEPGSRLDVAVVRRPEAGGPHPAAQRLCLSPPLLERWAAVGGPEAPLLLPEPLPELERLRRVVRAVGRDGGGEAAGPARRLLVTGGPLSEAELRPVLAGIDRAAAAGRPPAAVEVLCLPRAGSEAALLSLLADCAGRWPWPLHFGLAGGSEAVVRAAAQPGTLTLLPDRGSLCAWELRFFAALGLPALVPDLPHLRAQVPEPAALIFYPEGTPEALAQSLATAEVAPAPPAEPEQQAETSWSAALDGLLDRAPRPPRLPRAARLPAWRQGEEAVGVVVVAQAAADPLGLCLESWRGQSRAPAAVLVLDAGARLGEAAAAGADGLHRPRPGESVPAAAARLAREAGWAGLLLCAGYSLAMPDLLARCEVMLAERGLAVCLARGGMLALEEMPPFMATLRQGGEAALPNGALRAPQPALAGGLWRTEALAAFAEGAELPRLFRLRDLEAELGVLGLSHRRLSGLGFVFRRGRVPVAPPPPPASQAAAGAVAVRLESAAAGLPRAPAPLLAAVFEAVLPQAPADPRRFAKTAERLLRDGAADAAARLFCAALFAAPGAGGGPGDSARLVERLEEALRRGSSPEQAERLRRAVQAARPG